MQKYVLDRNGNVVATFASDYNDKHTKALQAGASTYEFTISKQDESALFLETGNYVNFVDDVGKPWSFSILSYTETHNEKTVYCEDVGIELINKNMNAYKADVAHPFSFYFEMITKNTPWTIGINEIVNLSRKLEWTSNDTGLSRLLSLLTEFDNAECKFNVKFSQNKPTVFKVDIYKQIGNPSTNVQIVYSNELNDITKTESRAEFVTAIQGEGGTPTKNADGTDIVTGTNPDGTTIETPKITFADIEYKDDNYVSEKGDNFLRAVTANKLFNPNSQDTYIEGYYSYDTESPQELLNRTLTQLKKCSVPQYTYEADVKVIDPSLDIGDTVKIIDHDYKPGLYLEARVASLEKSYTDPSKNTIIFTNYKLINSSLAQKLADLQNIINGIKNGSSSYVWIRYADDDKGTGISQSPKDKTYVAILAKVNQPVPSDNPNDYAGRWVRIVGEDGLNGQIGPQGHDGADGIPGKDGVSSYTHIAYADTATGVGFTQTPSASTTYIGMYVDQTATDSDDPASYQWTLIKGADGSQGTPGKPGTDGKTPYLHTAYSWSADGTDRFTTVYPGENLLTGTSNELTTVTGSGWGNSPTAKASGKYGAGRYYASAYIENTTPVGMRMYVSVYGDAGNFIGNAFGETIQAGKNGIVSATVDILEGRHFASAFISFISKQTESCTYKYKEMMVTRTPSPWAPSPLDDPEGAYPKFIGTYTDYTADDSTDPAKYTWAKMRGEQGLKGDSGADGKPGKDGVGIKSTAVTYQASTLGTTQPTGTWSVTVPSTTKGQYLWTRTVWTYTDNTTETGYSVSYIAKDGNDGTNGVAGKDGTGIKTTTITYAGSTSGTTAPTSGWTSTVPTVAAGSYLWTKTVWAYTDNTSETGYSVAMMGVKGDTGVRGLQGLKGDTGIKGPAGMDGKTSYTHIAYANSATGEGFSEQPAGKTYIGMYVDFEVTDSTNATKYKWSLVKGSDGANGTPGKTGADGRTPYLHVAYSNSANGATDFTTDNPDGKKFAYLGTYTDFTQADSTDTAKYAWSLIKGEDGANGKDGQGAYLHIAYSNSVDGKTDFTTDQIQAHNRDYLGTYSDNTKAQSTDPTKYTWQLTRGAQGIQGQPGAKDVPVVIMSSTAPPNPKNGDFWYQTTTDASGQKITGFSVYSNGKWVPSKIDQSTLVLTKLVSVEIDSAIINSPDITVPFDYFDKSNNEYKGSMEFKDGMLKHISTMPDSGVLKTIISPMGYTLDAYDNQSKYTQNNPYVHSEMLADNIGFYNTNTKKSIILGSSGIRGTLNGHTDQSTEIDIYWSDIQKYLSEMSEIGSTRAFNWFDIMSSVQSHPNLIRNSSFVNGKANWNLVEVAYVSNDIHDGNFILQIRSAGGANFVTQTLANFPWVGNQICVSFWANIINHDGGVNAGAILFFNGSGKNYTMTIQDAGKGLSTGWKFYSFEPITVPEGTNSVNFGLYNNEHNGNFVHFAQPMLNAGSHVAPYMPTY